MDEAVRFAWLAAWAATDLWDDVSWDVLAGATWRRVPC